MTKAKFKSRAAWTEAPANFNLQEIVNRAAEELAAGRTDSARELLNQAIAQSPASSELLMMAALVSLRDGDMTAAESQLLNALRLSPKSKDVLHNLALLYWGDGRLKEAREMFKRLIDLDPGEVDSQNNLAVFEDQCGNPAAARISYKSAIALPGATRKVFENYFEFLVRTGAATEFRSAAGTYLSRYGDDDVLRKWREQAEGLPGGFTQAGLSSAQVPQERPRNLKIAFFAAYQTFLTPIMDDLRRDNEIRLFSSGNESQMRQLLNWCDVAWFEWCDGLLIAATKMSKSCKIICRLHSYEAFTEMPQQVDWSKVDHLVLVNQSVQELLRRSTQINTPTTIIHNGVDVSRFSIPTNKRYGKKICSVGYINYKKNPALLLYCFKAIHDYDRTYRFHIAGSHQDPRIQVYFEHLIPKLGIPVTFDGWVEDMPQYLADKDYVISTSLFESFHYSIAEGMASGVLPLIHDWFGASYLYPTEYLFTTPEDCLQLLQRLEKDDRPGLGRECREYITSHYDQSAQLAKINALISSVAERK